MEIRCPDGSDGGRRNAFPATHEEIHPTGMLSVVANLTPWSDHNQSPRNMYQCQVFFFSFPFFFWPFLGPFSAFYSPYLFVPVDGKTNNGFFFTSHSLSCRSKAIPSSG